MFEKPKKFDFFFLGVLGGEIGFSDLLF